MRIILTRHFIVIGPLHAIAWVGIFLIGGWDLFSDVSIRFIRFVIAFCWISVQLSIAINSREMMIRKCTNYEKILDINC